MTERRPMVEVVARAMARYTLTESLRSGEVHEALLEQGRRPDEAQMALAAMRAEQRLWPKFADEVRAVLAGLSAAKCPGEVWHALHDHGVDDPDAAWKFAMTEAAGK